MSRVLPFRPLAADVDEALAIAACRIPASAPMRGRCFGALAALRAAHGSIAAARAACAAPDPDGGAAA